ncbi:hypothetical protein HGRIS_007536 [Hohenbuehelia grisea]|uniref:TMEM205-like domain-containing protein n=1 Tax=Hohenbuehelia grisea TaxID=104357 RepID=A0ABR3J564_9AGAR
MAKVEILTLSSLTTLAVSPESLYLLAYAWTFGMSVWISFFGGVIAFKSLPRHQFGALQHKTFPIYFLLSIVLSSFMLTKWTFTHPDVITHIYRPNVADVAQAYALATVILMQGSNRFVVGPLTSKTMFQRQRLEKEEGKLYNEPGVSDAMKALNRRFGMLHGISSLANLFAIIALGFHGLWIAHAGVKGY